jgi:UDP-GlcNAc:undecaprenyl-phosphate/decaprenyl-phosphate GlcNAc-1-phosphate transferase
MFLDPNYIVIFSFLLSFAIVFASIPTIVNVAHLKKLLDEPGKRKSHTLQTPNLGGIAIFAGLSISVGIFFDLSLSKELGYLFVSMLILFFVGIKDDILIIAPAKKLYGEILSAFVLTVIADIRITNLHGFAGIAEIGYIPSILLTAFVMVVIINSFNLIDGIDGLASGIGIIVSITFGIWFYLTGQINYAVLAAALFGALTSFFWFNVFSKDNKIFMGDTGSLLIGLIICVLTVKFNEINVLYRGSFSINSAPAVSIGIVFIPLFDTLRVFTIRILRKRSPFSADKNHLHHRLLLFGFSHLTATAILLGLNLVLILIAFSFQNIGIISLTLLCTVVGLIFSVLVEIFIRWHKHADVSSKKAQRHVRA